LPNPGTKPLSSPNPSSTGAKAMTVS
jgi:hypothetical protein